MRNSIRKAPFRCPGCSYVQQEPENLISTYCRSCGSHYEVRHHRADDALEKPPSFVQRALMRPPRAVHCHRCGHDHEVSSSSRSTICPACNASIEFGDLVFSSNVSRPVDTRGKLTVEKTGYLNNAYIVCGEGVIEGRVNGTLRCEGSLRLASSGSLSCRITAQSVVIEKKRSVELKYPLVTTDLTVYGALKGDIKCSGRVHILKHGRLEGRIVARSMKVDRGGIVLADSTIQPPSQAAGGVTDQPVAKQDAGGLILPIENLMAY